MTTAYVTVHTKEAEPIRVHRVPSGGGRQDFASVNLSSLVNVLLFNTAQATALVAAAVEAYRVLRGVESERHAVAADLARVFEGDLAFD